MPTFLIFRSGSVISTVKGADTRGLTTAIESAVKLAGPSSTPSYSTPGRTLGGPPRGGQSLSRPFNFKGLIDAVIAFLGLYFYSLFSFDAYGAAEQSPFNVNRPQGVKAAATGSGKRTATAPVVKKLGTIHDLGGD